MSQRWHAWLPARYISASILCSIGGFLLGFDTGIIGPVTVMDRFIHKFGHRSSAIHGFIVSSILLCAAISALFAGKPADSLGRPRAIALGAFVFTIGCVLQASAMSLVMFAIGRAVEGFGYGLAFGTQSVYICEISSPRHRGALTAVPQFMACIALVAGYFVSYGTVNISGSLSWRLPFILLSTIGIAYTMINLFVLPDSPRWLILQDRHDDARKVWDALDINHQDRALELADAEISAIDQTNPSVTHASFRDVWAPDVRKRTFLAVFLMGFLQLCGIDAVLYYAPLLFQQAGLQTQQASFLASGVSAIVIVVTSIPATLYADKWGRRTSTLVGGIGLTTTLVLMGALYAGGAVQSDTGAGRWVVIVSIYIYCVIQATTWAISIKVWAPEIQSQHIRAQATSLAWGCNWICNWFVAFICPILLAKQASAAYFLFGACTAAATVVSFFYMVETKGKSLDEIEKDFRIERHAGHIRLGNLRPVTSSTDRRRD